MNASYRSAGFLFPGNFAEQFGQILDFFFMCSGSFIYLRYQDPMNMRMMPNAGMNIFLNIFKGRRVAGGGGVKISPLPD